MTDHAGISAPDEPQATSRPRRAPHADAWSLGADPVFLDHGSFGAVPRAGQAVQADLCAEMEANPVAFLERALEPRLDAARARLAAFIGADPEGVAFVPNVTHGVATCTSGLRAAWGSPPPRSPPHGGAPAADRGVGTAGACAREHAGSHGRRGPAA